jgi:hypothetical protein
MTSSNEQLLLKRVNSRLAREPENTRIHLCRYDSRWFSELGRCYEIDANNSVVSKHVDLEDLAKEIGALASVDY